MPSPSLLLKLLIVGQVVMAQATKFSLSKTDLYGTLLFVSREQGLKLGHSRLSPRLRLLGPAL